jgi:hypothetical protein
MKSRVVLCLFFCLCLAGVLGADTRWTRAVSDQWSDPANWLKCNALDCNDVK